MSVYRRGKRWYIDIYLTGKRFRKYAGENKKQAQTIEAELKRKYLLKELNIDDINDDPLPFHYAALRYLEYCKDTKSGRTYEMEITDYNKHLNPFIGSHNLTDVSTELLLRYQSSKKGERYSNRTINIHVGLIRKIMKYAEDRGYIRNVKLKYPMLPESQKVHTFLDPAEAKKFIKHFSYDMAMKRTCFGILTGMRPKELAYCALSDINMRMKTVKISSKPPDFIIKTKQERVIPLSDSALDIIKELDKKYSKRPKWVFSTSEKPVLSIRKSIDTARKKASIKRKITPNMLRHTFVTWLIIEGADIKSVQELAGHSDIQTTMRYAHAVKEQLRKSVSLLNLSHKSVTSKKMKGSTKAVEP
jgi:site-specific recombinase XerD